MAPHGDVTSAATLDIPVQDPFDAQANFEVLGRQLPMNTAISDDGTLLIGSHAEGYPFVARIAIDSSPAKTLEVCVSWLNATGPRSAVASRVREILGLRWCPTKLYELGVGDEQFARVRDECTGLRPVRAPAPFETACWVALSTRAPTVQAVRWLDQLIEALGSRVNLDGTRVDVFPTPVRVAEKPEILDQTVGDSNSRRALKSLAHAFSGNDFDTASDEDIQRRLSDCWGFGPQSAEFVTRVGFGRRRSLPRYNPRLRKGVARAYGRGVTEVRPTEIRELSRPYQPEAGYWAYYIDRWYCERYVNQQWLDPRYPTV